MRVRPKQAQAGFAGPWVAASLVLAAKEWCRCPSHPVRLPIGGRWVARLWGEDND